MVVRSGTYDILRSADRTRSSKYRSAELRRAVKLAPSDLRLNRRLNTYRVASSSVQRQSADLHNYWGNPEAWPGQASYWQTGILLASLVPYFYERRYTLLSFYNNHPSRLTPVNNLRNYRIKFTNVVRNCESAALDTDLGLAILSCDPGRDKWNTMMGTFSSPDHGGASGLWVHTYGDAPFDDDSADQIHRLELEGFSAEKQRDMHPLGIGYWPATRTLYAVNHAAEGSSIEIFTLDAGGRKAVFQRTLTHELLRTPNSVAPVSATEIFVTNDHAFEARFQPLLSKVESYLSYAGGSVVHVDLASGPNADAVKATLLARAPFANGVALLNASHLAVASTTTPAINVYAIDPQTRRLRLTKKIPATFLVDNLSVDGRGRLLAAGHPYAPALEVVAKTNQLFDLDGSGEGRPEAERPRAWSWVAEWDGSDEGVLKDLYIGGEYGTACTALRDVGRGWGMISGLYEKGIMVWKE